MRKFTVLFLVLISSQLYSQDITDAVRFGSEELSGTARFTSMSGAFGALGGDFSAIGINPAGSAVFLNGAASISLNLNDIDNEIRFTNGFTSASDSDFNLNQAGAVFIFHNRNSDSPFQKFSVALTYDQTNNFENSILAAGTNSNTIGDYFLQKANGIPLDLLVPVPGENLADLYTYLGTAPIPNGYNYGNYDMQEAYLAYETFLLDAADPDDFANTEYSSNIAGNNFYQEYRQVSTGLNGKFSVNAATQFSDDLYMGVNINSYFINYERTTVFYEENADPNSEINQVVYENTLETLGSGLSLQLGAIYKIGDMFRVGAAYTSPTWYTISDKTVQYLETNSNEFGTASANPGVINIFPDYQLRTPGKFSGSFAVVFGQSGLISFDYSYKDFSNTEFDSEFGDHAFAQQNRAIENNLQAAGTYRVGGEYRISDWSLRAGYRMEESPYKDENIMGKLTGYSVGFGYDFGNIELDFAYNRSQRDYHQTLYQTGLSETAAVDRNNSNYTLTLNFGL